MYICDIYDDDDDAAAAVEVAKCLLDPPLHLTGSRDLNNWMLRLKMGVPSPYGGSSAPVVKKWKYFRHFLTVCSMSLWTRN